MAKTSLNLILVVSRFPQLSETFIFRKAVKLAERGHHVTVLTREDGDWKLFKEYLPLPPTLHVEFLLPDPDVRSPGKVIRLVTGVAREFAKQPVKALRLFQRVSQSAETRSNPLRAFVRALPFLSRTAQIVHFEFLPLSDLYPLAASLTNAHATLSCRGADLHMLEQKPEQVQKRLIHQMQTSSAVHAVAQEMASEITRISGRTTGIWINRPAVDTTAILPVNGADRREVPMIVAVGRLVWKKGFDYLLAALAKLKAKNIPFRAQIMGGGELFVELRFSIWDLGLTDVVELTGPIKPAVVLDRLKHADLFVLSSHEEGISNAVLEAMSTGLPIVTTDAGGMEEAINDGVEGYVVPVRDVDALADRLEKLLTDPVLRATMGKAARARAEADFSLERQADIFEQMYQSVLKAPALD